MKNPYEVLGVTSSASMDEIKRAYRDKARRYSENQAKMDELNDAYDFIINNFGSNNANTSYADSGYGAGAAGGQTSEFGDIRAKLNSGRIDDAEMLLDGIPYQRRNAEWYYLKGTIQHRKGWLESALENFRKAKEMEPGNSISLSVSRRAISEGTGRTKITTVAAALAISVRRSCAPIAAANVWAATL